MSGRRIFAAAGQQSDEEEGVERIGSFRFEESEEIMTKGRVHMEQAIEFVADADKAAYHQAKEQHSDMFQAESNPILFLRFANYNPWAAARRIVRYWQKRVAIFGERAFLPMDLSCQGALRGADMDVFTNGGVAILPNDKKNWSVVYFDWTRCAVSFERALFFVLQALTKNERSQREGFSFLLPVGESFGPNFERVAKTLRNLIRNCIPVQPPQFHIIYLPPASEGGSSFLEKHVPHTLEQLGPFLSKLAVMHVTSSKEDALSKLLESGFDRDSLPALLGGTLGDEYFERWQGQFGRVDGHRADLTNLVQKALACYSASKMVSETANVETSRHESARQLFSAMEPVRETEVDSISIDPVKRKDLTADEKDKILKDIFGTDQLPYAVANQVRSNQERKGLSQLKEALSLIPVHEKAAYVEAQRCVPNIVELESAPIRFLHHEEFNPWTAASRLCLYWKERTDLFGSNAFLPMSLCRGGALSNEEATIARTGFFQLLPRDKGGRPIIFHDRSRLSDPSMFDVKKRLRGMFYWFSVLSESDAARRRGYVGMSVFGDNTPSATTDFQFSQRASHFFHNVFPITMKAVHLVCLTERKTFRESLIPSLINMLSKARRFTGDRTVVHMEKTPEDLMFALERYGLRKEGLPTSIGGTWGVKDFQRFQEDRAHVEVGVHSVGTELDSTPATGNRGKRLDIISEYNSSSSEAEVRRAKKQKRHTSYARRKRERQRIEVEVLQEQCSKLTSKNTSLHEDNQRLEYFLKSSIEKLARINDPEPSGQIHKSPSSQKRALRPILQDLIPAAMDQREIPFQALHTRETTSRSPVLRANPCPVEQQEQFVNLGADPSKMAASPAFGSSFFPGQSGGPKTTVPLEFSGPPLSGQTVVTSQGRLACIARVPSPEHASPGLHGVLGEDGEDPDKKPSAA